jgi:hypothetical protein
VGEDEGYAAKILFQTCDFRCTWDGSDPWLLGEQPGEGDLSGSGFFLLGDFGDQVNDGLIGFAVFFGEAWDDGAEVGAVEFGGGVDLAGEEAFAERAEGDEADAEFFKRGYDRLFGFAPEKGVLALEGGNWLDGVGATDSFCASFGEAKVFDLARCDEVFDGPGGVLDGGVRVDAVLIVEVDDVGFETLERVFDDLLDVVGLAVGRSPLTAIVGVSFESEFRGNDDVSAEGASPTTSSLM